MKKIRATSMILLTSLSIFAMSLSIFAIIAPKTKADSDQGTWVRKADMPTPRRGLAAAALQGKIYVIGGAIAFGPGVETTPTDIVEIYDPGTDTWTSGTPTPAPIHHVGAVVVDDRIYVFNHDNNRTFCYDLTSDTWTELAPIPCRLEDGCPKKFGVGVVDGKIYVARGENDWPSEEGWTYRYDPATDTWSDPLSPIPYHRSIDNLAELDGKLYAIGGSDPSLGARREITRVDVYDPETDSWELDAIPRMSYHRGKPATSVIDGKIYVIGGWNGYTALSAVEVYDRATNSWTTLASMSIGRYYLATAVVGGKIYAIGGDYGGLGGHLQSLNEEFTPPAPALLSATVDIDPDTLNLKSKGEWITAYIELPEGYDVNDINVSTVLLNDTVRAESYPTSIGDYDDDGIPDLMVKFDRDEVISLIESNLNTRERVCTVTLTITGKLYDGTPFQGRDSIRVLIPRKGDPVPR